jgi:deoxycytidine triphosphate deaminase/addiction module HigA family antidote
MSADIRGNATADFGPADDLTPGEHLRAEIERLGLDQVAVSNATGVSRQSINNIVNGRQPISRAMAGKLGRLTGRSSDYWLRASFARDGIAGKSAGRTPAGNEQPDARPFGVGVLVNHQIVRAVNDGIVDIDPFIEANVQLASIDLTLDDFVITTEGARLDISDGQSFILKVGRTVNVSTREWIEFPRDYIGRVGAMTSLAKIGIMTSHGFQVDPGFQGNLQFCIFNAGGQDFELHSGMPIISLEIMPLSVTPTHDERAAHHLRLAADRGSVISLFKANVCDRLIRDAIRDRANVDLVHGGAEAKISGLSIEIADDSADAALSGAVERALDGLKTLREHPGAAHDERGRYQEFFSEIAERLYFTADHARQAVGCLGFSVDNNDTLIAALRDGKEALLSLPTKSGKISLRHLARQLREEPAELILLLAGSHRYADTKS